ncbi:MAG: hypothetical protein ACP5NV_02575 [Candidatus Woesearchaeota archaeon]
MIFKNHPRRKKGEDMLVDFWAILIFVLVMVLFLIVFILTKEGAERDNLLQEQFTSSDLDYMLNSYIKSPYIKDSSKTNGEIIIEDYLNNDFSRSEESFERFFLGVNTTNNNPIGEFQLIISESESNILAQTFSVDPKNSEYMKAKLYKGVVVVTKGVKTSIPSHDGTDINIALTIEYVMMSKSPFE